MVFMLITANVQYYLIDKKLEIEIKLFDYRVLRAIYV